ncbi:hypothetical protein [Chryseobacterium oncorhynchi]|uniref:Tetratricopeptide repeat protein n=1 Tax=Chryseobacterium oncorhynchi TaxID=741074 RepID=A0A316WXA3_9FLAO|nr:hypothetical protein [Chryseobacterium oncorhynchi]PWN65887.1 hypothetical protein C1638_005740 [Chryseobacterium oncorhynchi]
MKLITRIILLTVLLCQVPLLGQKISDDSLLKKANQEIYNNPDNAIRIGKKLLQKEKDINKSIKIYLLLSTAEIAKRNFDESLKHILKARELVRKTHDPKIQASFFISTAVLFQQMELYSKSLETLDEADEYLAKLPDGLSYKYFETARSYALRGMIYKSQSNPEIALQEFLIAVQNFEKVKDQKTTFFNQSIMYYNIGYCYLNLNQSENAETAFIRSRDFADLIKAKSLEAFALKGMAEVQKQKHQNQTALELLIKAQELGKESGDLTLNEGIYKEMSDNYLAMGEQDMYQIYSKKYIENKFKREQSELSSINNAIDAHNIETQRKSNEVTKHYDNFIIVSVITGFIILALIVIMILKTRRRNKNYKKKIQQLLRS